MTTPRPLQKPQAEAAALTFAQARQRWLLLSTAPQSWTEPARQRDLAAAFLNFHAAKLALLDTDGTAPFRCASPIR